MIIFVLVKRNKSRIAIFGALLVLALLAAQLNGSERSFLWFDEAISFTEGDLPDIDFDKESEEHAQKADKEEGESFVLRFPNIFDVFRSIF